MIAAQQHDHRTRLLPARGFGIGFDLHVGQSLDLLGGRDPEELCNLLNGLHARRVHLFRLAITRQVFSGSELRCGFFQVGGVSTFTAACHHILSGIAHHHELMRLRATHSPGMGLDYGILEAAAVEDAPVRLIVLLVGDVEPGGIDVKGV